ncbi:type II/IV secretion system protein [Candidatus Peregrinibacteria bacterium]|nr:type II/IV secretion system protein [Candidatus Peregrinibacteria bacterium]
MSLLDVLQKESEEVLAKKVEDKPEESIISPATNDIQIESKEEDVKPEISEKPKGDVFDEDEIPEIVDEIFKKAIEMHASDVHFKPTDDKFEVYYRIDGNMIEHKVYDRIFHNPIIARIKIISSLKIDEHRLPQDGKSSYKGTNKEVDLRVSILPTQYGEKVVIRLLEKNPEMVNLRDLGMLPNILMKVEKHLQGTYGMILAVGPTGSGKSTSLFSMISTFNAEEYNISTLEDPIEYKIPNVTQTQINVEIGFDFPDGLRTLVRQDPDIIMVGEIRDKKTASLAVESALTGHLVFSTLHTNTATGTIQRLLNMEIDRFLITAAVKLIISQRLIKKVCSNCREKYEVPKKYYELFKEQTDIDPQKAFLYKAKGCDKCNNTGYKGRIGLFEVLEMTPAIEELIIGNASNAEIEAQAVKEGMILLKKDALYKAITGDITIEEALRVML